jgi:hypothetical protein
MTHIAAAVMPGRPMQSLQRLDFYENAVHDAGAIRLAEALEVARALVHVDIRYNNIGIHGVERLHRAKARNTQVSHLAASEQVGPLLSSRTFDGVGQNLWEDLVSQVHVCWNEAVMRRWWLWSGGAVVAAAVVAVVVRHLLLAA